MLELSLAGARPPPVRLAGEPATASYPRAIRRPECVRSLVLGPLHLERALGKKTYELKIAGNFLGVGVITRVAYSRETVAKEHPVATVARTMQISRQAIYRRPKPRLHPQSRRPADA